VRSRFKPTHPPRWSFSRVQVAKITDLFLAVNFPRQSQPQLLPPHVWIKSKNAFRNKLEPSLLYKLSTNTASTNATAVKRHTCINGGGREGCWGGGGGLWDSYTQWVSNTGGFRVPAGSEEEAGSRETAGAAKEWLFSAAWSWGYFCDGTEGRSLCLKGRRWIFFFLLFF
jgi:hypothetical protein